MNNQTWYARIIASIKAIIKKLVKKIKGEAQEKKPPPKDVSAQQEMFKRVATAITSLGKGFKKTKKTKKKPRKSKHAGSKNHNKKRNKVRAKMAVESNRINRKRVKGWKH